MKKNILILLSGVLLIASCGGRLPSQSTSTHIVKRHFTHYSHKYKSSVFGHKKVVNVEILNIEEIHKHLVNVTAFVTMEGPEVFKIRMNIEKGPFGWRYLSWENLSEATSQ